MAASNFILGSTTAQIAALTSLQLSYLTTEDVAAITTSQMGALSTANLVLMSTSQLEALSTRVVATLKTSQVQALTTGQIIGLSTAQIVSLSTSSIAALQTSQLVAIETADIAVLTSGQLGALTTTTSVQALTTDQVRAISTSGIASLKTATVAALSTAQVGALTTVQVQVISTSGLVALQSNQLRALSSDQIVSLQTNQIQSLSTASIVALSTAQFRAIETTDLVVLTTKQIVVMTSTQAAALSTSQVVSLNTQQIQALNTAAYAALDLSTPIILDLNGDGVQTLSISEGVKFDIFGDGQAVNTGWVSGSDGLLVLDRNRDGSINDGSELFGSSTKLSTGERASDGYAALRELDGNADGVISSDDAGYADLRVWVDSNSDGLSSTAELRTLESLGIAKINLNAAVGTSTNNGNILGLTSSYETTDGAMHAAADVWFVADKGGVNASAGTLDAAIAALTVEPVLETSLPGQGQQIVPSGAATGDGLRSRVTSLAQAIGSFGDTGISNDGTAVPRLNTSISTSTAPATVSLAAVSMADVMKQFDSNGAMLGSSGTTAVSSAPSATKSLNLPGVQDSANSGILTTGGKS